LRDGRLGGVLFGGIFAAVGIGFLLLSIIPTLYEGWQMQGWQAVPAQVLETELHHQHSDNSTTYRVTARYRYVWQGRSYFGSRVGISSGSDNVGSWHQTHYQRLRSARDTATPLTVWVDPQAPAHAIIDRDIRWGLFAFKMVFVVLFGGIGLGIVLFSLRRQRTMPHSAAPWLENPAWRDNRIRAGGRAALWSLWLFGILWSLFMIPLWLHRDRLLAEGMPLALLPYLFPLVGVAVLAQAVITSLRWRRFGNAVLRLDPFPGELTGRVAGHLALPGLPAGAREAEVMLRCVHVYWRRSGNKRERREEVLWQDTRRIRFLPGPQGGGLAFEFRVPPDLPPSSQGSDHHRWTVTVRANLAGPNLDHDFTIPVFARDNATPSPSPRRRQEHQHPAPARSAAGAESLPEWVQLGYRAGGMALYLPMFRNLQVAIPLTLFGILFGAIGVFLLQQQDAPLIIGGGFTLFGGLATLGGVYALGNSVEVLVSPRGISVTRRLFGLPLHKHLPLGEIQGLEKRIGAQAGSRAFYRVYANGRKGGRTLLADALPSASAADYLMTQFEQQLHPGQRGR